MGSHVCFFFVWFSDDYTINHTYCLSLKEKRKKKKT